MNRLHYKPKPRRETPVRRMRGGTCRTAGRTLTLATRLQWRPRN